MAEITRKKQQVFAGGLSASGNIAIYGSKEAGSPAYSSDLDDIQSTRWLNGILGATSNDKAPYVQDLNAIFYTITKQLAYIFQAGVPEWNSQTEYFGFKSLVVYNGKVYVAVSNSTNKNPSTEPTYWLEYTELFAKYMIPSYDSNVASAINGYPEGAILKYIDSNGYILYIKSLTSGNQNAPSASNIKKPDSEAGTYYWEDISDVREVLYFTNKNVGAVKPYIKLSLNGSGNLRLNNCTGIYFAEQGVTVSVPAEHTINIGANVLTVNNSPIIRLPDYSAKTQVAYSGDNATVSWTATEDGWVLGVLEYRAVTSSDASVFSINTTTIFNRGTNGGESMCFGLYPVKTGDIVRVRRGVRAYFYPYR